MEPDVSIVVPVFNEEECVATLARSLRSALSPLEISYEIIFVNDGSTDLTAAAVEDLMKNTPQVGLLSLNRSYGHQAALSAGLCYARGRAVVTMDGDGQHPPETVPELIRRWRAGAIVVQAVRDRSSERVWTRLASRWFYRIFNRLSETKLAPDTADFRLLDRKVVDVLNKFPERQKFHRGLVAFVGGPQTEVAYDTPPRYAGRSKYSFMRRLSLAVEAIASFSAAPLHALIVLGTAVCLLAGAYTLFVLWMHFIAKQTVPGWSSLMIVTALLGGLQILAMGLIGKYLASIYLEVKGRPEFIVREHKLPGAAASTGASAHED